jgi:lipopolysaccharide/colanic/teichoic acid biosynthesis glycosyltransferase
MTPLKRIFDVLAAIGLGLVLLPVIIVISAVIAVRDGRPIFYLSERMRGIDDGFQLVKFRTMRHSDVNTGVSGGDKASRITATGQFLRRTRLDEIPQLWNVLRGDISFVGPRPPLRQYVEQCPEIYAEVLKSRPGITGLASVHYHRHEERLLSRTQTVEETDATYRGICVPRKAKIDLIYQRHRNICFDIAIMWRTVFKRSA